ncbi:MAG: hypothetical protein DHS80DRAFT_31222 [Piptocephalis tieghemiana]|nr:MAG: hypothetical protein DHS80DRAFT_31222 [Piptocephalis tieghemiana]
MNDARICGWPRLYSILERTDPGPKGTLRARWLVDDDMARGTGVDELLGHLYPPFFPLLLRMAHTATSLSTSGSPQLPPLNALLTGTASAVTLGQSPKSSSHIMIVRQPDPQNQFMSSNPKQGSIPPPFPSSPSSSSSHLESSLPSIATVMRSEDNDGGSAVTPQRIVHYSSIPSHTGSKLAPSSSSSSFSPPGPLVETEKNVLGSKGGASTDMDPPLVGGSGDVAPRQSPMSISATSYGPASLAHHPSASSFAHHTPTQSPMIISYPQYSSSPSASYPHAYPPPHHHYPPPSWATPHPVYTTPEALPPHYQPPQYPSTSISSSSSWPGAHPINSDRSSPVSPLPTYDGGGDQAHQEGIKRKRHPDPLAYEEKSPRVTDSRDEDDDSGHATLTDPPSKSRKSPSISISPSESGSSQTGSQSTNGSQPNLTRSSSVTSTSNGSSSGDPDQEVDEALLEKRRRNAHASARFRDRRRAREREMTERCSFLERRVAELEREARDLSAWRSESIRWREESIRSWERIRTIEAEVAEWRQRYGHSPHTSHLYPSPHHPVSPTEQHHAHAPHLLPPQQRSHQPPHLASSSDYPPPPPPPSHPHLTHPHAPHGEDRSGSSA